jgi:hypothetical protein
VVNGDAMNQGLLMRMCTRTASPIVLILVSVLAACAQRGEVTVASVTTTDDGYRVEWATEPIDTPVGVYVAADPEAPLAEARRLAKDLRDGVFETSELQGTVRHYFLIDATDPERVSESSSASLLRLPRELLAPILWSDPVYIVTMFDELEQNHGSALAFIREELGVPEEAIQTLRDLYLE